MFVSIGNRQGDHSLFSDSNIPIEICLAYPSCDRLRLFGA